MVSSVSLVFLIRLFHSLVQWPFCVLFPSLFSLSLHFLPLSCVGLFFGRRLSLSFVVCDFFLALVLLAPLRSPRSPVPPMYYSIFSSSSASVSSPPPLSSPFPSPPPRLSSSSSPSYVLSPFLFLSLLCTFPSTSLHLLFALNFSLLLLFICFFTSCYIFFDLLTLLSPFLLYLPLPFLSFAFSSFIPYSNPSLPFPLSPSLHLSSSLFLSPSPITFPSHVPPPPFLFSCFGLT